MADPVSGPIWESWQTRGLKMAGNPENHPLVLIEGDHGGMLLPEAKLTSEAFAKADDKIVPIGQLWLRKLTPMRDGSALASDKLRIATVKHKDQDVLLAQCALGVRRNRSEALELLVFGKDKERLVTLPLKRVNSPQELPLDFTAERTGDAGCLAEPTVFSLNPYVSEQRASVSPHH